MPWSPGPLFSPNVTICMKHPSRTDSAWFRMAFACFRNSGYTFYTTYIAIISASRFKATLNDSPDSPRVLPQATDCQLSPIKAMANVRPRGELSVGGNEAPLPFLGGVGPYAGSSKGICSPGHSVKLERGAPECGCAWRLQINLPVSRHCL